MTVQATMDEILRVVSQIKDELPALVQGAKITPIQIVTSEGLSDISRRLGLVQAGEFRAGNGKEPGLGFTGVRMGYPPFTYAGSTWHIAGVNNDALQVGISATDGKLYAGGGNVTLGVDGIRISSGATSYLAFARASDGAYGYANIGTSGDNIGIYNNTPGAFINLWATTADGSKPALRVGLDAAMANRGFAEAAAASMGMRFVVGTKIEMRSAGGSGGETFIRVMEGPTAPVPGANDAVHIYVRNDYLVFQYGDGGTTRYKYLPLTGVSVTWLTATVAP